MSTIKTKFIVVSLPRTGTMSMCQMAMDMGLNVSHAPGPAFSRMLNNVDFIADTPAFMPSTISKIVEDHPEVKFIYIEKAPMRWVDSMRKVNLSENYNNMFKQREIDPSKLSIHNVIDLEALDEVLQGQFNTETAIAGFRRHHGLIKEIIPADRLLEYSFSQGWYPLVTFMGVPSPMNMIPHLNKDTMFDKLS